MTLATALLMAVVQLGVLPEEWHKLTSSGQTAGGIDTRSIQRSGDDISARMLVAMRIMDESTKRIAASYVVAKVTVNCRTRAGRMTVGPLYDGDGKIIEPATDGQDISGPVSTDVYPALCGRTALEQPGAPTINRFLHQVWPPVPGIGRGW